MTILTGPLFAFAAMLDVQVAFWRGMGTPKPAQIIPFPKRKRRPRSGERQACRDAINAALDER